MSDKRYFDNPFDDYSDAKCVVNSDSTDLKSSSKEDMLLAVKRLFDYWEKNIDKYIDANDYTIYTGSTGYSLLYLHLSRVLNDANLLDKSLSLIQSTIPKLKSRRYTFLCGDSGVLSVGSVVHYLKGNHNESNRLLALIRSMVDHHIDMTSELPDELLYGRSGYLFSLLFVRKYIPNCSQVIDDNLIRKVVKAIIRSGQRTARIQNTVNRCPLMYVWHEKAYVGAAHGLIGIIALLLEAKHFLTEEDLNKLVRPTIEFILSIRFSSGNFPSSLSNDSDRLVHWCHGCPGAVHLFCLAFQIFSDERYLNAAKDCCECIWQRGLLIKGWLHNHQIIYYIYIYFQSFIIRLWLMSWNCWQWLRLLKALSINK